MLKVVNPKHDFFSLILDKLVAIINAKDGLVYFKILVIVVIS